MAQSNYAGVHRIKCKQPFRSQLCPAAVAETSDPDPTSSSRSVLQHILARTFKLTLEFLINPCCRTGSSQSPAVSSTQGDAPPDSPGWLSGELRYGAAVIACPKLGLSHRCQHYKSILLVFHRATGWNVSQMLCLSGSLQPLSQSATPNKQCSVLSVSRTSRSPRRGLYRSSTYTCLF